MVDISKTELVTAPPARNRGDLVWSAVVIALCGLALLPVVTLVVLALAPAENIWPHLLSTVLPRAVRTSLILMLGVGVLTAIVGTLTAWLVTMCRFPARGLFEWLLLAPLAVPTYITAYCYMEVFDYSGPVQSLLRALFGWRYASEYWFFDIRSLGGAIFVMAAVLYPYVYLTARASFLAQSICMIDVSRTLGHSPARTFFRIALPLARPALIAGVTLALMETVNDIGAVEFFGVRTLTVSIYSTWLGRGNLAGAAQLAGVLFLFVFALIWIERTSRHRQRFHQTTSKYHPLPAYQLTGLRAILATTTCAIPIFLGLAVPLMVLLRAVYYRLGDDLAQGFFQHALHSVALSAAAAVITVTGALLLVYARRLIQAPAMHQLTWLATIGYAVPGTVLAIGILVPLAAFDNLIDSWLRGAFGISSGLLLSGSAAVIVLAYSIRFLAVAHGAIEAGLGKVSPHLAHAARTLGRAPGLTLIEVYLPMIRPSLVAASLLVFVDAMKELPATVLLRPFNFETLATHVYSYASLERFEDASLSALAIVLVGLVPVIWLNRTAQLAFRPRSTSNRL